MSFASAVYLALLAGFLLAAWMAESLLRSAALVQPVAAFMQFWLRIAYVVAGAWLGVWGFLRWKGWAA